VAQLHERRDDDDDDEIAVAIENIRKCLQILCYYMSLCEDVCKCNEM